MTTSYPTGYDALTNPDAGAGDDLDTAGVEHDDQHANANDAIEKLEQVLGLGNRELVAPVADDWTDFNIASSVSVVTANGVVTLLGAGTEATVHHRGKTRTVPETPYTEIFAFRLLAYAAGVTQFFIGWRESSSGKLTGFALLGSGAAEVQKWTNATTFSANYSTKASMADGLLKTGALFFVRLGDDGTTNRTIDLSLDGRNWINVQTVGRTDHLTADEFVFAIDPEVSGEPMIVSLVGYE